MKTAFKIESMITMGVLMLSIGCSGVGSTQGTATNEPASNDGYFASSTHTLPANTLVPIRLQTTVSSDTATVGQPVQGEVTADVVADGAVLIPAGTRVQGTVSGVKPAKRFGGQAMVAVAFNSVKLANGDTVPVEGGMAAYAKKETGKDTGAIVGGAVGGAILGKIIGKDTKGAVEGAVIGGGIGTAIASRKGDDALLPAGTSAKVQTTSARELPEA